MEPFSTGIALMALFVSAISLILSWRSEVQRRKAEDLRDLLGEKETVGFAALRLLREGLPTSDKRARALVIDAVMQACVLEGSDRSRALLFRVLEINCAVYGKELTATLDGIEHAYTSMAAYRFDAKELDLANGRLRLGAARKILDACGAASRT